MNTFKLHILSAERSFFEGMCESVIVPTSDGMYGIMAGHTNMISAIEPGVMEYTPENGTKEYASISNGIMKMEAGKCLILADTIEKPEEIDELRAKRAIEEAKEALLQKKSMQDYHGAELRMKRELSRLKAKNEHLR